MVFVKSWDDFEIAAEGMYMRNPDKSRFSMKYIHHKGELILKITDNVKVKHKMDLLIALNIYRTLHFPVLF